MKKLALLILVTVILNTSCRKVETPVTIQSDGLTHMLNTSERLPEKLLSQAEVTLGPDDSLLYLGEVIPLDKALPAADSYTLLVRRAVELTILSPDGDQKIRTSALTVGQALEQAGFSLSAADRFAPPANTPLVASDSGVPLTVEYQPARDLTVTLDGKTVQARSAAPTVGQALAEAGVALVGLDYSLPSESDPLPPDGEIRVVRVTESITLAQETIPYGTRTELSADLELDQQALLQGGELGLKITRTRSRVEDREEVSQTSDGESLVRPPQDRILGIGSKIVIRTAVVDGVSIEYWRALTLYATPYAPCVPETPTCQGGTGTAMGTRVRKGEVAMVYPWYLLLAGERVFVPGYGVAAIEDNNGANTSAYWGTYWIDLGFPDMDSIDWINHYVTVYFLTPIPANIADLYVLP
jgi:resuscitation-promoting factor RpfB